MVSGGRVVDSTVPSAPRPDVARSLGVAAALDSGFLATVPATAAPVQLYSLNTDGTVTPLVVGSTADAAVATYGVAQTVRSADGVVHRVVAPGSRGVVDIAQTVPARVLALSVPPGGLGPFHWLELRGVPALSPGAVVLTDVIGDPTHQITFTLLPTIGSSAAVRVGSCQQWHGYAPAQLRLVLRAGSLVPAVWLSR